MIHLPPRLMSLFLPENFILGTVVLARLPKTLKTIDFTQNRIESVIADAQNFPKGIEVFVSHCDGNKVQYMDIQGKRRPKYVSINQ